jgi:hypothetical protein
MRLEDACLVVNAKSPHISQALPVMSDHRLGRPSLPRVVVVVVQVPDPVQQSHKILPRLASNRGQQTVLQTVKDVIFLEPAVQQEHTNSAVLLLERWGQGLLN